MVSQLNLISFLSSFPWSFQSLLGYFVEVVYDVIISEAYFISNGTLILLFISLCVHHRAFLRCFEVYADKLNVIPSKVRRDSSVKMDEKKKLLFELIRFHASIKWYDSFRFSLNHSNEKLFKF